MLQGAVDQVTWHVGDVIRKLRKRENPIIEIGDLAAHAGLDKNTIGRIERGVTEPDMKTLTAIADALGLSKVRLLGMVPLGLRYEESKDAARLLDAVDDPRARHDLLEGLRALQEDQQGLTDVIR